MRETTGFAEHPPETAGGGNRAWDEVAAPSGQMRAHWSDLGRAVLDAPPGRRSGLSRSAARMIEDLGSTYNVFRDVTNEGQPYGLDPVPLVIPSHEWPHVSAGLKQRIRLLDAILGDLYGAQTLLERGFIPPGLVHSNPGFLLWASSVQPVGGRFLTTTSCDLVRLADGNWWVLGDHTDAPGGLGQVYENRNVLANLLAGPFGEMRIARLRDFIRAEQDAFRSLVIPHRDGANLVFLTQGFRHPSYFEHAYKARLLGIPLVEKQDLTVRGSRVFLKTLAGLHRIDGIIYRLGDDAIDPLLHRTGGGQGVPGLGEAWRRGNVAVMNAPGSGFASSQALLPFLPRIAREWFGEELRLPSVETWWLGQEEICRKVMENPGNYVFLPAFPGRLFSDPRTFQPFRWAALAEGEKAARRAAIEASPQDFVVQPVLRPSMLPVLSDAGGLRKQPVVWRAFMALGNAGPHVLPGGLARVGDSEVPPQMWPGHEGATKDVWISDWETIAREPVMVPLRPKARQTNPLEVPSRIAEQLFWVGRYAERIEHAARLLRVTLRALVSDLDEGRAEQLDSCIALLRGTSLLPEEEEIHSQTMEETVTRLISDGSSPDGIPARMRALIINAASARDRLSDDTWRLFNLLEGVVHGRSDSTGTAGISRRLDSLILHLAAFSGMQAENMTRGHGWRFMETGRRVERALGTLALLQSAAEYRGEASRILECVLDTCDSTMTYRRRNFSRPERGPVIELLHFDATNPRSVASQLGIIARETRRFPGKSVPALREIIRELRENLRLPRQPGPQEFAGFSDRLGNWSDLLTQHFFSHSIRRTY